MPPGPITGRSTFPKRLAFLKNCAKRWKKSGKIFSVEKSNLNKFSMTVRSTRVMENIRYPILRSENSFPLDGERLGWGCKSASESPPPFSSPVQGEERDGQKAPHSSLIAAVFLIGLLFLATDACAQLKKIRLCAPGLGSGIMHAYIAKERGYFAQEGLDFDVLVTRGQICTMALLNGQM